MSGLHVGLLLGGRSGGGCSATLPLWWRSLHLLLARCALIRLHSGVHRGEPSGRVQREEQREEVVEG